MPFVSAATQRVGEPQETADKKLASTVAVLHAAVAGAVDVTTFPEPSTATHSTVEGQEIAVSPVIESAVRTFHFALGPAVGSVEMTTLPR